MLTDNLCLARAIPESEIANPEHVGRACLASMSGVIVREAGAEDALGIAELLGELGYPVDAARVPERLQRLRGDVRAAAWVAARESEVLGLVTLHRLSTLHAAEDVAQLTSLAVSSRTRGVGVGRLLVETAETEARLRGCARIVVTTATHRAGAHAFYERLGYAHTGRRYAKNL